MKSHQQSRLIGQAGVMRIASELMLKGINVLFPSVDSGVDIYTEHGTRLQVKTSTVVLPGDRSSFMLSSGYRVVDPYSFHVPGATQFSDKCDFVVLLNITLNRVWVIPSHLIDGLKTASVGYGKEILTADQRNLAVKSRNEGRSWAYIALEFGVSTGCIRGIFKRDGKALSKSVQLSEFEGKWDLIKNHDMVMSGHITSTEVTYSF